MTEYTIDVTADAITRLYLYGTLQTPSFLTERLRDLNPSDTPTSINVSAASYMATYGVYAVPARSSFVQSFFNGTASLGTGTYTVA